MTDFAARVAAWEEPPAEYRPIVLWAWDASTTPVAVRATLQRFQQFGAGGVIAGAGRLDGPRPGGYLDEAWFELLDTCIDEAERLGLKVWLYDRGDLPGPLPERARRGAARHAVVRNVDEARSFTHKPGWRLLAAFYAPGGATDPAEWHVIEADAVLAADWQSGVVHLYAACRCNDVNRLDPAGSELVIERLYEPFRRRYGRAFAGTIAGIFQDHYQEIRETPAPEGGLLWDDAMVAAYRARWDADPVPRLPLLFRWPSRTCPPGKVDDETRRTCWTYYETAAFLGHRCHAAPLAAWCEAHGIALAACGYGAAGQHPAAFREFHVPAGWLVPGKFEAGDERAVIGKAISSAAHLYARPRCAAVLRASGGESFSLPALKRAADTAVSGGVDSIGYEPPGDLAWNKRLVPSQAPAGAAETLAPLVRCLAVYLARLCAKVAQGRHACDIAIYSQVPWGAPFVAATWCRELQRDFDYLDRETLAEAPIEGGMLHVAEESYRLLILEFPHLIPLSTLRRIGAFSRAGGLALLLGGRPELAAEPGADEEVRRLSASIWPDGSDCWIPQPSRDALGAALDRFLAHDARLEPPSRHLRVLHRCSPALDFYFLVNASDREPVRGAIWLRGAGAAECWDAETGERRRLWHYPRDGIQARIPLALGPCEATCVAFTRRPDPLRVVETNLDGVDDLRQEGGGLAVEGWTGSGGRVTAHAARMLDVFQGEVTVAPPPAPVTLALAPAGANAAEWAGSFSLDAIALADDLRWSVSLPVLAVTARLVLNGVDLGARLWPPYRWAAGDALRPGANDARLLVDPPGGAEESEPDASPALQLTAERRARLRLEPEAGAGDGG